MKVAIIGNYLLSFVPSLFPPKVPAIEYISNEDPIVRFHRVISYIHEPNSGGCLFIAYVFYLNLLKHNLDTSSFQIKQYATPYDSNIEDNIAFLNGQRNKARASAHFTWFYEGKEYDAEQRFKQQDFSYKQKILPIKDYKLFCENALVNNMWNDIFNRNIAIKIVKQGLGINLTHLKL